VGRSKSWVYKWQTRLENVSADDDGALHEIAQGQSHARKHPPERIDPRIEALILTIRDDPPEGLRRTPGPKAILYYLPRKITLWESGLRLPTSTRTIYQILERNQRIVHHTPRAPQPDLPREAPLQCWQIDFKDVSTVVDDPMAPTGKKQHVAEAFNIVDEGTSILLLSQIRTDFTAETLLETLASALERYGLPQRMTLDRDPRSVGASVGSDFLIASVALMAWLWALRCTYAPHTIHKTMGLWSALIAPIKRNASPSSILTRLVQARIATEAFIEHYNTERPNQARSCGNRPPRTAFPSLPTLSRPPAQIEADAWLKGINGFHVERKIDAHGMVHVDLRGYYVDVHRALPRVTLEIQAAGQSLLVWQEGVLLKTLHLRGLVGGSFSFKRFVEYMGLQARAQHRLRSLQERRKRMA
jgi:hypothetical protein